MSLTTSNNDGNNVDMRQRGYDAEHSATVTLDGTAGTSLYLDQSVQQVNLIGLNFTRATAGGCLIPNTKLKERRREPMEGLKITLTPTSRCTGSPAMP